MKKLMEGKDVVHWDFQALLEPLILELCRPGGAPKAECSLMPAVPLLGPHSTDVGAAVNQKTRARMFKQPKSQAFLHTRPTQTLHASSRVTLPATPEGGPTVSAFTVKETEAKLVTRLQVAEQRLEPTESDSRAPLLDTTHRHIAWALSFPAPTRAESIRQ